MYIHVYTCIHMYVYIYIYIYIDVLRHHARLRGREAGVRAGDNHVSQVMCTDVSNRVK